MKGKSLDHWGSINKSAREILARLKMDIVVSRKVSSLTLAEKQMSSSPSGEGTLQIPHPR